MRAQLRRRELDRAPLSQAVRVEAGPVAIDQRDPQNPELVLTVRGVGYKFEGGGA